MKRSPKFRRGDVRRRQSSGHPPDRRPLAPRRPVRTLLGERLVAAAVIDEEQLTRALDMHERSGIRVGKAVTSLGFASEDDVASAIADQAGLPFVDLRSNQFGPLGAHSIPERLARKRGVLPLGERDGLVVVGCTNVADAHDLGDVARFIDRPVTPVFVAESALDEALGQVYRDEYLQRSALDLAEHSPENSAQRVLSSGQYVFFLGLASIVGAGLIAATVWTLAALVIFCTLFYIAFCTYKLGLAYRALTHNLEIETTDDEVAALDDRDLPIYTILVPVYREAEVFPILVKAIGQLEYPKAKLDVKILLEEDDTETIGVARAANLPGHFKLVVVPSGAPKGKPRACNYGLIQARGEYVVIFDAEDIPEPDQLKKALIAFRKGGEQLACVQAKLNYFNSNQNLLTRWFTAEYSMWFDIFLPGLDASGAPIPLGGTSNHFRVGQLQRLGAWDPHNVTEDADLGIRLYKAGLRTAVIESTTYEEANSQVYNWIRQRSRWVKGYIQTYLVHMRNPLKLWRELGPRAFFSFQFVVGGTFFVLLINPIFWALTPLYFATRWAMIEDLFVPSFVYYLAAVGLYFGNFTFAYVNMAGCLRRGYHGLVKVALLSPLYWVLMSIAAWKGFLQLFYAPSYWEKTDHGLYRASGAEISLLEPDVPPGASGGRASAPPRLRSGGGS